jgi:hypothetical protein
VCSMGGVSIRLLAWFGSLNHPLSCAINSPIQNLGGPIKLVVERDVNKMQLYTKSRLESMEDVSQN